MWWSRTAYLQLARRRPRPWEAWRRAAATAADGAQPSSPTPTPPTPTEQQQHHHHVSVGGGDGEGAAADQGAFIGSYTPVTRALWRSRLAGGDAPPGGGGGGNGRVVVSLPFSSDASLRATYANPWGFVRLGRLLEDLDSLSGTAAFAHVARGPNNAAVAPAGASGETLPPPQTQRAPKLVTASVDAIHLARPLLIGRDLTMSARVVWSGSSSLDVRMEVTQSGAQAAAAAAAAAAAEDSGAVAAASAATGGAPKTLPPGTETEPALVALFSYVALDRETRRPVAVPPFVPQTQEEKAWFEERQRVADARRRQRQREKERLRAAGGGSAAAATATATAARSATAAAATGSKQPDDADDQPSQAARADLMRRFSQAAARLADLPALSPPRLLPVSLTRVDNALITQPQHKNTSGAVFGGFLMRRAFELSFAAAFLFAGCRPAFVRCDDVSFAAPVDVGDLMRFSARALAAWRRRGPGEDDGSGGGGGGGSSGGDGGKGDGGAGAYLVAIEAVAERARPDRRTVATTNTFRYVFRCTPDARGVEAAGAAAAGAATGATAGAAAAGVAAPPVLLRVPIPTTAEDAQRVGTLLSELSDADVAAVAAALDGAERE